MPEAVVPTTVLRGHRGEVQALAHLDTHTLLSGDSTGVVRCWDLESARATETLTHTAHAGVFQVLARAGPGGSAHDVLTQGRDGELKLWSLRQDGSLTVVQCVTHTDRYHYCKCCSCEGFSESCVAVAAHNGTDVEIWDVRSRTAAATTAGDAQYGMPMSLACPRSSAWLIAGTESGHMLGWDLRRLSGGPLAVNVHTPKADPDAPCLAVAAVANSGISSHHSHHSARLPAAPGPEACTPGAPGCGSTGDDGHSAGACGNGGHAGGNDDATLVAGGPGKALRWHSCAAGQPGLPVLRQVELPREGVGDVGVRPDGRVVAVGGWDGRVRLFHMRTGKQLTVLKQHRASVAAVAFNPATGAVVSGSRDTTITLWDVYLY